MISFVEPPAAKYITTEVANNSITILRFGCLNISKTIIIINKNADHFFESIRSASLEKTFARSITTAGFANSEGCKLNGPTLIHLCAPLITSPVASTNTSIAITNTAKPFVKFSNFL